MTKNFRKHIYLSILPAAVMFTVFMVIPIVIIFVTSFFQWDARGLVFNGLGNYERLLKDRAFKDALRNTAIWMAAATLLHIPFAALVAIILSKKLRGWKIFRTLFFLPNIVSYAALSIVFLAFYNARYGLLNSALGSIGLEHLQSDWLFQRDTALPALILTWVFQIGLYMIIIMAEIVSIPDSIYEAAQIDGASHLQQDFFITLPLLRNVLGTCMILSATRSLIYFEGILLMTNGGPMNATLNLPMFAYKEYSNYHYGYTNTIGFVILIFGLITIVVIRRLFRIGERDA